MATSWDSGSFGGLGYHQGVKGASEELVILYLDPGVGYTGIFSS